MSTEVTASAPGERSNPEPVASSSTRTTSRVAIEPVFDMRIVSVSKAQFAENSTSGVAQLRDASAWDMGPGSLIAPVSIHHGPPGVGAEMMDVVDGVELEIEIEEQGASNPVAPDSQPIRISPLKASSDGVPANCRFREVVPGRKGRPITVEPPGATTTPSTPWPSRWASIDPAASPAFCTMIKISLVAQLTEVDTPRSGAGQSIGTERRNTSDPSPPTTRSGMDDMAPRLTLTRSD